MNRWVQPLFWRRRTYILIKKCIGAQPPHLSLHSVRWRWMPRKEPLLHSLACMAKCKPFILTTTHIPIKTTSIPLVHCVRWCITCVTGCKHFIFPTTHIPIKNHRSVSSSCTSHTGSKKPSIDLINLFLLDWTSHIAAKKLDRPHPFPTFIQVLCLICGWPVRFREQ